MEDCLVLALMACFNFGETGIGSQFDSEELRLLGRVVGGYPCSTEQSLPSRKPQWLPLSVWDTLQQVRDWAYISEIMDGLSSDIDNVWATWFMHSQVEHLVTEFPLASLSAAQKFVVISLLRPDGMINAAKEFITGTLGEQVIDFAATDIQSVLVNLTNRKAARPVLFLFSDGSDVDCLPKIAQHLSNTAKVVDYLSCCLTF